MLHARTAPVSVTFCLACGVCLLRWALLSGRLSSWPPDTFPHSASGLWTKPAFHCLHSWPPNKERKKVHVCVTSSSSASSKQLTRIVYPSQYVRLLTATAKVNCGLLFPTQCDCTVPIYAVAVFRFVENKLLSSSDAGFTIESCILVLSRAGDVLSPFTHEKTQSYCIVCFFLIAK